MEVTMDVTCTMDQINTPNCLFCLLNQQTRLNLIFRSHQAISSIPGNLFWTKYNCSIVEGIYSMIRGTGRYGAKPLCLQFFVNIIMIVKLQVSWQHLSISPNFSGITQLDFPTGLYGELILTETT